MPRACGLACCSSAGRFLASASKGDAAISRRPPGLQAFGWPDNSLNAAALGTIVFFASLFGDLIESVIKRDAGLKVRRRTLLQGRPRCLYGPVPRLLVQSEARHRAGHASDPGPALPLRRCSGPGLSQPSHPSCPGPPFQSGRSAGRLQPHPRPRRPAGPPGLVPVHRRLRVLLVQVSSTARRAPAQIVVPSPTRSSGGACGERGTQCSPALCLNPASWLAGLC